jgi:pimeloyl-ACP methyl ester carboxylesterase
MVKVAIGGVQLAYEERGNGFPLVLLHGFPFSRLMWDRQLVGLAKTARVIAPDLRGFGESEGVPATIEGLADDLHSVLDALAVPAVAIAGFSMGGYVLLRYLTRHADRVKGVILVSTRADADAPDVRAGRLAAIERLRKEGPERYLAEFARRVVAPQTLESDPSVLAKVRRYTGTPRVETLVGALTAMAERPDSTPVLATITVPTLVIAGDDDKVIPASVARGLGAAIKGAKVVIIRDAGHMVNIEQSDQFTSSLRDFLHPLAKS